MGFVLKLFKELNSAENDKFITLAVILGLISGFLPFFNVFTLIILLTAFIIRIPFGLYLASWGVFSIVGYFLDPLFAKTGYIILTSSFLTPLWEFLYNVPLMRWSGFNNTVVMGGFVWGAVFSVILYFIINKSINLYRTKFFNFCSRYKFLKWIVPDLNKKTKIFRMSGIISFVVIFGGLGLVISIFFDPIVKKVMEFSLSKVLHKNVKIEKLNTSFINATIDIKNLYVGDVKTDNINLKLSWKYLVWKKFDIENLVINNIHTDKSIKYFINSQNQKEQTNNSSVINKINISLPKPEQIIKGYKFESLQKVDKLKSDYKKFITEANEMKKTITQDNKKIANIKTKISELEKMSKNIKSVDDIQKILAQTKIIQKDIQNIQIDVKNKKNRLMALKKQITNDLNEIKKASQNDYEKLSKKYDLLKNGKYYQFVGSFLQPEIKKYTDMFVKYYKLIKPYLKKSGNKNKYVRSKGVYIKFKDRIKYPDFVLQNCKISGKTKDVNVQGSMKYISSNQALLDKKAVIKISSTSTYFESAKLNVEYLKNVDFSIDAKKISLNKLDIKNMKFVKPKINVTSKGKIIDNSFDIKTDINLISKGIEFEGNKYIANALKELNKLNVKVLISGNLTKYNIEINSDIDKLLSKYMKKAVNSKIKNLKAKLNKLINNKVGDEINKTGFDINKLSSFKDLNSLENSIKSVKGLLGKYTKDKLSKQLMKKGIGKFLNF